MEHQAGESEVTTTTQQDPASKIRTLSARKTVEVKGLPELSQGLNSTHIGWLTTNCNSNKVAQAHIGFCGHLNARA